MPERCFRLLAAIETAHEIGEGGFGSQVGDDADVEAVLGVLAEGSLDRARNPLVAIAEDAAPEQGEIHDAVAGSDRVDDRRGQRRFIRGIENQLGEVGPLVRWLPAVRDGQSRAVGLRDPVAGAVKRDFGIKLQANAKLAEQRFSVGFARSPNRLGDLSESLITREEVAIVHLPKTPAGVAESLSKIGGTVELLVDRLTGLAIDVHEVVAVDRAGSAGDRARRPLSRIVFVDADAAFGGDRRASHLEQVELRGNLEERSGTGRVSVQGAHITENFSQARWARLGLQIRDRAAKLGEFW